MGNEIDGTGSSLLPATLAKGSDRKGEKKEVENPCARSLSTAVSLSYVESRGLF